MKLKLCVLHAIIIHVCKANRKLECNNTCSLMTHREVGAVINEVRFVLQMVKRHFFQLITKRIQMWLKKHVSKQNQFFLLRNIRKNCEFFLAFWFSLQTFKAFKCNSGTKECNYSKKENDHAFDIKCIFLGVSPLTWKKREHMCFTPFNG